MKRLSVKILFFLLALAVLCAVVLYTQYQINVQADRPLPPPQQNSANPDVSVVRVSPASYSAEVNGYGEARTHFEIALAAQVSGQVETISAQFENGKRVSKGDKLATLENSDYEAAVHSAKQMVAQAQVSLLEEQRQGIQARAEWESSGLRGDPDSALVLREPQLAAAKASLAEAKAILKGAEKDLNQSALIAPFDALIIERNIAPGSFVQTGTTVATLHSTDRVEIAVSLPASAWQNLPEPTTLNSGQWPASLVGVEDGRQWKGYVLRSEQHLDGETRQRALIIAVDKPFDADHPIYPGTFVEASVAGRHVDNLWRLPQSALSQRGEIWYVKADNTIDKFSAVSHFNKNGFIYVDVPKIMQQQPQLVLVHPLNSYLQGMRINPVEVTEHE